MHFGFTLDLSDTDLWNIDLLDKYSDLLDTDIPNKYFVCLQDVLKTSSRHVLKTLSRHILKASWRRLQRNSFSSSKTSSKSFEDVFKTSCEMFWRRLQRGKIVMLKTCWRCLQDMSWRRLQNVLKINKCFLGS